jgi:hypothetical protein
MRQSIAKLVKLNLMNIGNEMLSKNYDKLSNQRLFEGTSI